MDFAGLRKTIKETMPVDEWRFELHDFCEFVIKTEQSALLNQLLEVYFGREVDLTGGITPEIESVTDRWGGLRRNQHLYIRMTDAGRAIALLWPWGDGTRISVKVIQEKPIDQSISWSAS